MSSPNTQFILSAAIGGLGAHPGASGAAQRLVDLAHYRRLVQAAEHAKFDFVLLDDARALPEDHAVARLDALSLLARLAPETQHLGLALGVPTTYSEPFHVSRELATLDLVSGGRAAWNVTTTATDREAQNYGRDLAPPAKARRARAEEFVAVSRKLWDSWEDDAVIVDRARGLYLDPHKLHHINHVGAHFQVRGPQITHRPPQGHVVVIQIDQGDPAVVPSAAVADVLVLHHASLEEARSAYAQQQALATSLGREARILQRVLPILAATADEAQARAARLDAATPVGAPEPHALRLVGTASQVANELARWFRAGAADGFHLLPATLPEGLEELVATLIPELQRRGLFRTAYAGRTLREHLGLSRPLSQYAGAPSEAHTAYQPEVFGLVEERV
jgi:alkanesulfonate monooxygenase SsuD/methylene tetrahydromethanopterin reductase-like flavin-dependent oxidoreductase (luciferase family)